MSAVSPTLVQYDWRRLLAELGYIFRQQGSTVYRLENEADEAEATITVGSGQDVLTEVAKAMKQELHKMELIAMAPCTVAASEKRTRRLRLQILMRALYALAVGYGNTAQFEELFKKCTMQFFDSASDASTSQGDYRRPVR
ncbi:hypothetical protein LTR10_013064 [Elasticomyces elasticus]|uniref:Uncharacterized protein n=1 Tax=Exophiala sideris TaxID=1016849 RepID=A0ABR0JAR3_9EURO|nr:hypothetical protein LTR10_013064 [Elasticomyces elasticus]KAK5030440.1 hypothetical protein LTS07_005224 [Exophiala sideris]KAK5038493.1 hypothetical protein LTR13_004240 [Exophiala sideris]KAK5060376.1 hypothetical protein LTR69_005693 [Exophiala sideris]KAK5183286.1 hypothetical protein LTR44_004287 [Eurotiomycetes sp. CCFEE 6388]